MLEANFKSMEVIITGAGFDVGSSLKEHIKEKLNLLGKKFKGSKIHKFHVVFHKTSGEFNTKIDIIEEIDTKTIITSSHSAGDPYVSFDAAVKKLEEQCIKHKERQITKERKDGLDIKDITHHAPTETVDDAYTILGDDEDEEVVSIK